MHTYPAFPKEVLFRNGPKLLFYKINHYSWASWDLQKGIRYFLPEIIRL